MAIEYYLIITSILFSIGLLGLLISKRNLITILMSLELILLAVNINFIAFSSYLGDIRGQIFSMFILTVAAAETAIGLGIFLVHYRNTGNIEIDEINILGEKK